MRFTANLFAWFKDAPSFPRGVHPSYHKESTRDLSIEILPTPPLVTIPLHQHAGAPAVVSVKPRCEVVPGDMIGTAPETVLSAHVHASISGKTQPLTAVTLPNGRRSLAVPIRSDGVDAGKPAWNAIFGGEWPPVFAGDFSPEQIISSVRRAGIVGLGGAAFPSHVKLQPGTDRPLDVVLLNGSECEPYLTADERLMVEAPRAIVNGLLLARQACGAARAIIAVEDNKPAAIAALRSAVEGLEQVEVAICESKYPMGGERQLIPAVLDREVPTGGYPVDVGVLILNVATAAWIAAATLRSRNLTHRVLSVTGNGIVQPRNLFVPVGTPLRHLIDYCGGLTPTARRVVAGGPMMGFSVTDLSVPVTKATSGITVLSESELAADQQAACIRCGRCIDVCPLGLMPTRIAHAAKFGEDEIARRYDISVCCECGCCAYACPSRIPLVQFIRSGKARLRQR